MHMLTSILCSHCFVIFSSSMFSTVIHNRQTVHHRLLLHRIESEVVAMDYICGGYLELIKTTRAEAILNDNNHR
jgi:hypothetical protein